MLRTLSLRRGALITLAAALLVLALSAACGGKSSNKPTPTPAASASAAPSNADSPASAASKAASPAASAKATSRSNNTAGTTNQKWTRGLCSATQAWSDDITDLANQVDSDKLADSATAKDTLVTFLAAARDRTQKFKGDVDALGNPDGKDGKAIEQAFSDGAGQAVKVFDDAVKSAQNLNVSDESALENQISDIGDQLNKASEDLNETFSSIDSKYDTKDLTAIAQDTPECDGLF
jgi:hypothetical protein